MTQDKTCTPAPLHQDAATAGALHDFNNALQAMAASLRHLERKVSRGEIADLPELVKALNTQVMSIGRLGAALSNTAPDDMNADQSDITVAAFMRNMAPQIRALLGETTRLTLVFDPDAGQVRCDPVRLESAVRNLVLNACDAMPGGGELMVRAERVELPQDMEGGDGIRPGCFAAITITDTGCGIEPELLGHCFEPFVTTKTMLGGTGLGLFQLRTFARQAGGTVQLRSVEGEGTSATILLPCSDPPKP